MIVTLTPDMESRLRGQAERICLDADDLTQDQIAQIRTGIRRGPAAASEGRERPVAEYAADVQRRRATRHTETVSRV